MQCLPHLRSNGTSPQDDRPGRLPRSQPRATRELLDQMQHWIGGYLTRRPVMLQRHLGGWEEYSTDCVHPLGPLLCKASSRIDD